MTFRIRFATAADIPAMHHVRRSVRENRLSADTTIDEAAYARFVSSSSIWVAESERRVCGFSALDVGQASVWALFVRPENEGRGVGRALHNAMLDWARAQGISRLSLSTQSDSRAERFYEKSGWERTQITHKETFFKIDLT